MKDTNPKITKAIICLGGGLKNNGEPTQKMKTRLDKTIELYKTENYDLIITSSRNGYRKRQNISTTEARKGKEYLASQGIPREKILIEEASMDTIGNAYFTRVTHIDPAKIKNITVVTSQFHIKRTKLLFNIVYGDNYNIEYIGAPNNITKSQMKKRLKHEEEMCNFYSKLFKNTQPGDLKALHEYIFKENPAYANGVDSVHEDLTERINGIWEG